MTKLEQSIKYAVQHMPMKRYASITADKKCNLTSREKEFCITQVGDHAFYARASIAAGTKETVAVGASDVNKAEAVYHALARLQLATVTNLKQFSLAVELAGKFILAMTRPNPNG